MHEAIDSRTKVGPVWLTVTNLDRSLAYYQDRLGFTIASRVGDTATLGTGGPELLALVERPSAPHPRGTTGLYHFAVLVPSRAYLARVLRHIMDQATPVQGFADHLVSESIYLADPDGNGIEIYRDRRQDEWPRVDGRIRMSTDPLDVEAVLAELGDPVPAWKPLPPGTTIGHVHLHVAHLADAASFYVDTFGFDEVMRYGAAALFVSAGGYHHHVGLNTWAGVGAPRAPAESVGLRHFTVRFASSAARDQVLERLSRAGVAIEDVGEDMFASDPSGNRLRLTVDAALETA
jgi:catechol 2,3-dioxygenase